MAEAQNWENPALQFPWRLHDILTLAEKRGKENIVSWIDGGKAFRVHKPEAFEQGLMKDFFNQSKYKSFQRQLNLWGFERIKQGPNKGGYFHPLFIKGKKQLCNSITRIKVKNPGAKSAPTSVPVETGSQPPVDASAERRMPLLSSPVSVEDSSRLYRSLASGYPASGLGSAMQSLGNPPSLFSRDFMPPFSDDLLMSHMALQSEVARLRAIHARAVLADHEAKHARATLELMVSLEEAGKRPVHGSLDDRLEFQALRRSSWHFFDQPRETPSLKQRRESLSSLNAQLKTIQKRRALLGLVSRLRDKKKLRH